MLFEILVLWHINCILCKFDKGNLFQKFARENLLDVPGFTKYFVVFVL